MPAPSGSGGRRRSDGRLRELGIALPAPIIDWWASRDLFPMGVWPGGAVALGGCLVWVLRPHSITAGRRSGR